MPTSTKVKFRLDKLKETALESIDFEIAQAQEEADAYRDSSILEAQQAEWRRTQEARLSEIFSELGDIDNASLSTFRLDPLPEADPRGAQRAERKLSDLLVKRNQIIAKASSLVADEDGSLALTKTQLEEFFGL